MTATTTAKTDRVRFTRFDRIVWIVVAAAAAAIALLVARGDQIGLGIAGASPSAASTGVSTRTDIAVQFDQAIATAPEKIRMAIDPPIEGRLRVDGSRLVFAPNQGLAPNTTYSVQVEPGVEGVKGRKLAKPFAWQFTTRQTQVLFAAPAAGGNQLFLSAAPASAGAELVSPPVQVTHLAAGVWDFAVAPDGSQIVFSAINQDGGADLWVTHAAADEPAILLACGKAFCSEPALSPDGKLLAYSQRSANSFASAAVSPPRLYIMDMQSKQAAPLAADGQQLGMDPQWSPDSKWLAYIAPDRGGMAVANLDTGEETVYPTMMGVSGVWSTQQDVLLMTETAEQAGQPVTYLVLIDPVQQRRVNLSGDQSLVQDNAPAWSPDGQWVAFLRNELAGEHKSLSKQLWLMRADGTGARRLTFDPAVDHSPPAWSPDGRYLLYHQLPLKGPGVGMSVWMMDPSSGQQWQVVDDGQRPLWVP